MGTSIVILTYNKLEYTKKCIESIRKYTKNEEYEIIIVDNNSTDGTNKWIKEQEDIKGIFNDKNEGFPEGCNIGINNSKKDNDILLLNNDTIVSPNWLTKLRECLYSEENIGAVGPVTNSCTYYQQIDVKYKNINEFFDFATKYNNNEKDYEERQKLIGFCMLIKRKVIEEIGLLDRRFTPGNYEDDDYSIRMIKSGYKLVLCKNVFIHHYGGSSFKGNKEYLSILNDNENKFYDKYNFVSRNDMNIFKTYTEFIKIREPNILEIYCGTGATALYMTQKIKCNYYGYDDNIDALNISKGKMHKIKDLIDLEYNDLKYDYLIISNVEKLISNKKLCNTLKNIIDYRTNIIINIKDKHKLEEVLINLNIQNYELIDGINLINKENQLLSRYYLVLQNKEYKKISDIVLKNEKSEQIVKKIIILMKEKQEVAYIAIYYIQKQCANAVKILGELGKAAFKEGIVSCGEIFKAAFDLDENNYNSIFNYSEFFYTIKEYDLAMKYINKIENKDNKVNKLLKEITEDFEIEKDIKRSMRRIEYDIDVDESANKIVRIINDKRINEETIIFIVNKYIVNKIKVLNILAVYLFENQNYDYIIPLLNEAYEIDNQNAETNYNLAFILYQFGEGKMALQYLQNVKYKTEDINKLINEINNLVGE